MLGYGFVDIRVERLAGGVNLLQARLDEGAFQLLLDHQHARFKRGELVALGALRGGQGHFKIVEDRQNFLDQREAGILRGLDLLAGGAFLEIVEVGGRAEQSVPVFICLDGA